MTPENSLYTIAMISEHSTFDTNEPSKNFYRVEHSASKYTEAHVTRFELAGLVSAFGLR
jgi:hypothetical protein